MKKLIYILAAILLGISSCKKEDESMVLSATIIDDCSGNPLANFPMILDVDYTCVKIGKPCVDTYFFDTDANGSFTVDIVKKGFGAQLRAYSSGTSILDGIPLGSSDKELHLGTFVARPTTSFMYRIKVNNPYNVGDTLVLNVEGLLTSANANKPLHSIAAPLSDTTFALVTNYQEISALTYDNIGKVNVKMEYAVANSNRELYFEKSNLVFPLTTCPSKIDTITLVVD